MDAVRGVIRNIEPIVLAETSSFQIASTRIFPSRLAVAGSGAEIAVEPRVMQVLIALHQAGNETVLRSELMERCWPGVTVGDDSLNRAIAELRRVLRDAGAEWSIETVPRIGYRINSPPPVQEAPSLAATAHPSRRALIVAGAGLAAAGAIGAVWRWKGSTGDTNGVEALIAEARQALREGLPGPNRAALKALLTAEQRSPDNAEILGLLALAWRDAAEFGLDTEASDAARACEATARRALAIEPDEANALSALATLQPFYGDWKGAEERIVAVLRKVSDALPAISHLTSLYQSSGYLAESKAWNDKALQLDPLSPVFQFRGALKHWFEGELPAADAQIDRALELWPDHPAVWNTRMMLYAYTGRAAAGRQFLANKAAMPRAVPPAIAALWKSVMAALDGDRAAADAARAQTIDAAMNGVPGAHVALMYLSYAGELDAAFEVANGFFLRTGPLAASGHAAPKVPWVTDQSWRRSMMIFTPPMADFRADPRFATLAEGMGLTGYWKSRGKRPDYPEYDARYR